MQNPCVFSNGAYGGNPYGYYGGYHQQPYYHTNHYAYKPSEFGWRGNPLEFSEVPCPVPVQNPLYNSNFTPWPSFVPSTYHPSEFPSEFSNFCTSDMIPEGAATPNYWSDRNTTSFTGTTMKEPNHISEHFHPPMPLQQQHPSMNTLEVNSLVMNFLYEEERTSSGVAINLTEAAATPQASPEIVISIPKIGVDFASSHEVCVSETLMFDVMDANIVGACIMDSNLEVELEENGVDKNDTELFVSPSPFVVHAHKVFDNCPQRAEQIFHEVLTPRCDLEDYDSIIDENFKLEGEWEGIYELICHDYETRLVHKDSNSEALAHENDNGEDSPEEEGGVVATINNMGNMFVESLLKNETGAMKEFCDMGGKVDGKGYGMSRGKPNQDTKRDHMVYIDDDGEAQEDEKLVKLNHNVIDSGTNYLEILEDVLHCSQPDSKSILHAMLVITGSCAKPILVDKLGAGLESIGNRDGTINMILLDKLLVEVGKGEQEEVQQIKNTISRGKIMSSLEGNVQSILSERCYSETVEAFGSIKMMHELLEKGNSYKKCAWKACNIESNSKTATFGVSLQFPFNPGVDRLFLSTLQEETILKFHIVCVWAIAINNPSMHFEFMRFEHGVTVKVEHYLDILVVPGKHWQLVMAGEYFGRPQFKLGKTPSHCDVFKPPKHNCLLFWCYPYGKDKVFKTRNGLSLCFVTELLKLYPSLSKSVCQYQGEFYFVFGPETLWKESEVSKALSIEVFASIKGNGTIFNHCVTVKKVWHYLPSEGLRIIITKVGHLQSTTSKVKSTLVLERDFNVGEFLEFPFDPGDCMCYAFVTPIPLDGVYANHSTPKVLKALITHVRYMISDTMTSTVDIEVHIASKYLRDLFHLLFI